MGIRDDQGNPVRFRWRWAEVDRGALTLLVCFLLAEILLVSGAATLYWMADAASALGRPAHPSGCDS